MIQTHYVELREKVKQLALTCGRDPQEITLIVVSKGQTTSAMQQTYEEGAREFGENRLIEFGEKADKLPIDSNWHFIGHLQRNKVRQAIGKFTLIHSVDSLELAKKIDNCSKEQNVVTSLLLQVNVSREASKQGFTIQQLQTCFAQLQSLNNIRLEGLMTLAPLNAEPEVIRSCFSSLRLLRDQLGLKHLSMGMSQDYAIAIEEGATLLRIGSAIFQ